jgi:hypothetical protein
MRESRYLCDYENNDLHRFPGTIEEIKMKRDFRLFLVMGIAALLGACRSESTPLPITSTPMSTEITPTATFIFPTIPPTETRIPDSYPSATPDPSQVLGEVLFTDDFNENLGWELGDQGIGAISLQSGRLVIALRQSNSFLHSLLTPITLRNFYLEIEVRADLCQAGDEFGLMFRVNQEFEHYRYAIRCEGEARAVRILSSESRSLVPIVEPPALLSGPKSTNRLGLMATGDTFRFWINDVEVFNARDISITEGGLGLFVKSSRGNQVTVSFDKLRIYSLMTIPQNTSTPTP